MFRKPVNYFYNTAPSANYGAVQYVNVWQEQTPPENIASNLMKFMKTVQTRTREKHNFQQDINNVIYYTPEQIEKFGIKLEPSQTAKIYQQVDLKNLNATDVRNESKKAVQQTLNDIALKETNKQIAALQIQLQTLQNKKATYTASEKEAK